MQVPRLGVKSELQPLAYNTAMAMPDLSYICNLHCNLWQHQILNPLSEARDRTCVLKDTSQIRFHWATTGTPLPLTFNPSIHTSIPLLIFPFWSGNQIFLGILYNFLHVWANKFVRPFCPSVFIVILLTLLLYLMS